MYLYPENLKSKATLWFWELKDVCIFGGLLLLGLLILSASGNTLFLVIGVTYGLLTMQLEEITVRDFLVYAAKYLFVEQQYFEWRMENEKEK